MEATAISHISETPNKSAINRESQTAIVKIDTLGCAAAIRLAVYFTAWSTCLYTYTLFRGPLTLRMSYSRHQTENGQRAGRGV